MEFPPKHFTHLDDHLFQAVQRQSDSLKERLLELYLLYTTSKTCNLSLQTEPLLESVHDMLKNALQVEEFCLMLEAPESGRFEMWNGDQRVLEAAGGVSFEPGEGVAGEVVATGEPALIQDVERDERFLHYKGCLSGVRSFLCVPLLAESGRVFGVLNIHRSKPNAFRTTDKDFFSAVAHNLASALERARLYEAARKGAMHDDLTGLYNRRFFRDYAGRELLKAQRHGDTFALLMIDVDEFKAVNDEYGHAVGDRMLVRLADILKEGIRESDLAARYGGEEFVLLLPETGLDNGRILAEKLQEQVERELAVDAEPGRPARATVTIGVSAFPDDGDTVDGILDSADRRMYSGKVQGRNQVVGCDRRDTVDPDERRRHTRYQAALRVVRNANESGEPVHSVEVWMQEQWITCALMDASREGFNALVRIEPRIGASYPCRAVYHPGSDRPDRFSVQVRHAEMLGTGGYLIGVQVDSDDREGWVGFLDSIAY